MDDPRWIQNNLTRTQQQQEGFQVQLAALESVSDSNLGNYPARKIDKIRHKLSAIYPSFTPPSSRTEWLSEAAARHQSWNYQDSSQDDTPFATSSSSSLQPSSSDQDCSETSTLVADLPAQVPPSPQTTSTGVPSKEELLLQIDELQNVVTGLRLTLRQANLQRKELQAASHQLKDRTEPVSEEKVQQIKAALVAAKEVQAAKKNELQSHVVHLNLLRQQSKVIKQQEKANSESQRHNKAKKARKPARQPARR